MSTNSKGQLKELCEGNRQPQPDYSTKRIGGEDHRPVFESKVATDDGIEGNGVGHSVMEAEQEAARQLLIKKGEG